MAYDGVLFDLFSGLLNSQPAYDEVAGKLGCSQNAARLRVSRALRTLTLALGAEGTAS